MAHIVPLTPNRTVRHNYLGPTPEAPPHPSLVRPAKLRASLNARFFSGSCDYRTPFGISIGLFSASLKRLIAGQGTSQDDRPFAEGRAARVPSAAD